MQNLKDESLKPNLVYLLNDFGIGGAEKGLIHLIDNNFFSQYSLTVIALFKGSNILANEMNAKNINCEKFCLINKNKQSIVFLIIAAIKLYFSLRKTRPDVLVCSLEQANIIGRIIGKFSHKNARLFLLNIIVIILAKYITLC